jgi:hypothetical protein
MSYMQDLNQVGGSGIGDEISRFVSAVDSLRMTIDSSMGLVQKAHDSAHTEYDAYIAKYADTISRDGEEFVTIRSHDHCHGFHLLGRELDKFHAAQRFLPRTFLLALVSRYDALVGSLVRALFKQKPEALRSSDRTFTFAELSQFQSMESAREFIVEREVETLLRKSHSEQFDWLEKRFDIKLREGLEAWPAFVEITERRNLFAHADGVVSMQYMTKCRAERVELGNVTQGTALFVDGPYFGRASDIICEIGVKLAQVLWRKVVPSETEDADCSLKDAALDIVEQGRYELAKALLDFGDTTLSRRHASESWRLWFVIHRALAYSLSGDKNKCTEILSSHDWSATEDSLKLAESVLSERFDASLTLMKKIGPRGDFPKGHYLHWPLFRGLRRSPMFTKTIEEIFGNDTHEEQLPTEDRI